MKVRAGLAAWMAALVAALWSAGCALEEGSSEPELLYPGACTADETRVDRVGSCGACNDGARNGLWVVKYVRWCKNGIPGDWEKVSSGCGPCGG